MGILPTTEVPATDGVIDEIAEIEMQRRETERKAGFATSCSSALQRLNELLDHESKELALRGPNPEYPGNVEALTLEIGRVKALAAPRAQESIPRYVQTEQRPVSWHNAPRNPARNKGRRTMGRAGGR